jgi:ubiquinone/menaquinone biosynthesis C-methylase UbiE
MSADGFSMDEGGLSSEVAARVYNRIGRLQESQAPFERPALDSLIAHGRFDVATSVLELGCGTGNLAKRLLANHLPTTSSYLGIDVSERMVALSRTRIARFANRWRFRSR